MNLQAIGRLLSRDLRPAVFGLGLGGNWSKGNTWRNWRKHVYHPKFAGSYSIKNVLPALVPGMTYQGMEVADGTDAGLAWESLLRGGLDQVERDRIEKALLDYCGQDTLALIKLVERLQVAST